MPDFVVWIIIGVVALIALIALIVLIVKIAKLSPEEREKLITNFLVGLVTQAENLYVEQGMGKEKIQEVEDAFNKTAPWFLKLLLCLTKSLNLDDLIEKALTKAKETWGKTSE